jgi:outer membrane lipoprotein LolB
VSRLFTLTLALFLGACTTVPPLPQRPAEELEPLWLQHRQDIGQLTGWSLQGRIVVNTEDDGWNGELRWTQSPRNYQIHFSAPFGQGAFKMEGDVYGVVMRLSDGQVFQAPDAESLLLDHIGWRLPLSEFRHWVTGVPETLNNDHKTLNNNGQLASLQQDQWQITYPEYFAVGDIMMPRKVYFKNHALSVRLVIDRWVLRTGENIHKQSFNENS